MQHAPSTGIRQHRQRIGLLAALLLGGCASVPHPAAVTTPRISAQNLLQRSLGEPGLQRFLAAQTGTTHPANQPWTASDLSLAALYFHPKLKLDQAALHLAEADLRIARQYPNPSLDLGLKYGAADVMAAPSPWTVGAAIGLLILSHSQRAAQTTQAEAGVRAAQLLLQDAHWQVQAGVQQAFVALWAARHQARLQQQVLDSQLDLQGRTAVRAQSGLDAPLAAALAQEAAQRAALQLAADRGAVQDAQAALAAAIGLPASALNGVALDFAELDAPTPQPDAARLARLRNKALAQRLDVRAAWQRVHAAQAALQLAQAQPDGSPPRLAPGGERDQGVDRLTLTARVPLPLFNQHQGQIDAARARLEQSQAALQQVQLRALAAIDQAEAALRAAQEQHAESLQLRDADLALLHADLAAQHRGLLGPVTVLRARLRALVAAQAALKARAAQWRALDALQTALQQPLQRTEVDGTSAPSPTAPSSQSPRNGPPVAPHLSTVIWRATAPDHSPPPWSQHADE